MPPSLCDWICARSVDVVLLNVLLTRMRFAVSEGKALFCGCGFDLVREGGTGDAVSCSRFRLFVGVGSVLLMVLPLGLPLRPDDRCCSESDTVGAGVDGASGFAFGGRPGRRFGGSGTSDVVDITD